MDKDTLDKIKAYLEGTLSGEESDAAKAFLDENRDDPQLVVLLRGHWARLPGKGNTAESMAAFRRFESAIGGFPPVRKSRFLVVFRNIRNAAAVIAIPLIVLSILLLSRYTQPELNYTEYSVAKGQRDSVRLPDNTIVWLNSGSKIIYPETFGRKSRKVFLSGEAFLNVAKDPKRPFALALSSGEVSVRVLGTQFNVTSYDDMGSVTVSLIEGSIEMDTRRNNITQSTRLVPGEVVRYDRTTGELERNQFSTDAYCSWRNGGFYFSNQTLREITTQFERVFNVKIFIHDLKLRETRYSLAFVNRESLDDMLEAINYNGRMHITRDRDMIFITSK